MVRKKLMDFHGVSQRKHKKIAYSKKKSGGGTDDSCVPSVF